MISTIYASIALFIMSCVSLILALLFRLKFAKLKSLSNPELAANTYDKTFVIFNPYPESRKIIHEHLLFWTLMAGFTSFILSLAAFALLGAGFGLSIFTILVGLNLIIMDDAFDVYKNSNIFIEAINKKSDLGFGDVEIFSALKVYTRRLSYYYLSIAVFLTIAAVTLPYILDQATLIFALLMAGILEVSSVAGLANWQFASILFAILVVLLEILIRKVRNRLFKI